MRTRPTILTSTALLMSLATAACSSAPSSSDSPAPFDPVGMYDFTATLGSDTREGTLEIVRTAAGLDGEAWLTGEPQPALADSVTVRGSHVVLYMLVGGGDPVNFDIQFAGPAFAGVIVAGMDSIGVTGQRRAQ